jgi:endonuclease YncB( thermonuclease family)
MGICCSFNKRRLKTQDNSVPLFSLSGKVFDAKVVDVYDGDTCSVVIHWNQSFHKFKVRCCGYDCPEIKPLKTEKDRDKIIEMAHESKNYFVYLVTNPFFVLDTIYTNSEIGNFMKQNTKIVKLKCHGWDKYGRLLGDFYVDGIHVNQKMIDQGFAVPYDGGTKQKFNVV